MAPGVSNATLKLVARVEESADRPCLSEQPPSATTDSATEMWKMVENNAIRRRSTAISRNDITSYVSVEFPEAADRHDELRVASMAAIVSP